MPTRTLIVTAICILGLLGAVPTAPAQAKPDFGGDWKVDTAKSDFGPMPAPQSSLSKIAHQDPKLNISTTTVSDRGENTFEMALTTDGAENTNHFGSVELKSKVRWEGAELTVESKAATDQGEFTVKERWNLSEVSKTLKIVRSWSGPMGEATQTLIHAKQ